VKILLKFTLSTGHHHPHLGDAVEAYAELLSRMGRTEEQILATLREMAPGQFS